MIGLTPQAHRIQAWMMIRACWITVFLAAGGAWWGGWPWAGGGIVGYFVAVLNLLLMGRSLARSMEPGNVWPKTSYLFLSVIRLLVLAGFLVLSLKWSLPFGLGAVAGLSSVMLAAVSAIVFPFGPTGDQPERKEV